MLDDVVKSQISRIVAFVLTPILLPVAGVVADWVQDVLGLNLNGADLTAYVVAVVAGLALVIWQWLRGRAEWEKAIALTKQLHDAGTTYTGTTTGTTGTGIRINP